MQSLRTRAAAATAWGGGVGEWAPRVGARNGAHIGEPTQGNGSKQMGLGVFSIHHEPPSFVRFNGPKACRAFDTDTVSVGIHIPHEADSFLSSPI